MEMPDFPDVIYASIFKDWLTDDERIKILPREAYTHSRIVEALRKENEELKARLDGLLNIINKQHSAHLELQAKLDKANKEIEYLHTEIDENHARLRRWADSHEELRLEVELRTRIAELEAMLEARGYDVSR